VIRAVVVMATLWLVSGGRRGEAGSATPDRKSSQRQHWNDFDFEQPDVVIPELELPDFEIDLRPGWRGLPRTTLTPWTMKRSRTPRATTTWSCATIREAG